MFGLVSKLLKRTFALKFALMASDTSASALKSCLKSVACEKVIGSKLLLRPLLSTAFTLLILKDLAPKRVIVEVMELLIASMEVRIPTNAVIPMATMEAVINARRRCAFKAAMP